MLYKTVIRPLLEYAFSSPEPLQDTEIDQIEGIQEKAVRFIRRPHDRYFSPSSPLSPSNLAPLSERRHDGALKISTLHHNKWLPSPFS